MDIFVLSLILPFAGYFPFRFLLKKANRFSNQPSAIFSYLCMVIFIIAVFVFIAELSDSPDYYQVVEQGISYTPLSHKYLGTPAAFFGLSVISVFLLWIRGRNMPPLLFVFCFIFIIIGAGLSIAFLRQLSSNTEYGESGAFVFLPIVYLFISLLIVFFCINETAAAASGRKYNHKILNSLNRLLANVYLQPVWVLILLFPVFAIAVLILTLFGQDTHSITKVFTETTTWYFSQRQHPAFLENHGHYLCTVAARGHMKLVKPLRYGTRRGCTIIVNRQLLVANAFEQLLEEKIPSLHRTVRVLYDKYGYPLSRRIMKPLHSDIVYILMKPIEYFFVVILYLCCNEPERKIAKQYAIPE